MAPEPRCFSVTLPKQLASRQSFCYRNSHDGWTALQILTWMANQVPVRLSLFPGSRPCSLSPNSAPQNFEKRLHDGGGIPFAIRRQKLSARPDPRQAAENNIFALQVANTFRHDRDSDSGRDQTECGLNLHRALDNDGTKSGLLAESNHEFSPTRARMIRIQNEGLVGQGGEAQRGQLRQAV